MGLFLAAACSRCDYAEPELRLGATHAQIEEHDVNTWEIFPAPCCGRVQSVLVFMGQPLPSPDCAGCGQTLDLERERRYRIARLSGDVWEGHRCPACGADALNFTRGERFV